MIDPDAPGSALPQRFGRFVLLEELGRGGMGVVYRAEMTGHGGFSRMVALKLVHAPLSVQPDFSRAFVREARLGGVLSHPNLVATLDFGEVDGRAFLAMELVDGISVDRLLAWQRAIGEPLPVPVAARIVARVCRGLEHAHGAMDRSGQPLHLVHRDLKPSNVLIGVHGEVKVADFGIARADGDLQRTRESGGLNGTALYLSPEQARGGAIDARSDLFAAGLLLYELLALEPFNDATGPLQALHRAMTPDVGARIERLEARVPAAVREVLERALRVDPADRFPDAKAMAAALSAAVEGLPQGESLEARAGGWVARVRRWQASTGQAGAVGGSAASGGVRPDGAGGVGPTWDVDGRGIQDAAWGVGTTGVVSGSTGGLGPMSGQEEVGASKSTGQVGREEVDASKSTGQVGREEVDASKSMGRVGREAVDASKSTGQVGLEEVEGSKSTGRVGREAVGASKSTAQVGREGPVGSKLLPADGRRSVVATGELSSWRFVGAAMLFGFIMLAGVARWNGVFEALDTWRHDHYALLLPPPPADRVTIIDLGDDVEAWPWRRGTLARLLERVLIDAGARAAVIDVVLAARSQEEPMGFADGNRRIAAVAGQSGRPVVLAWDGELRPGPATPVDNGASGRSSGALEAAVETRKMTTARDGVATLAGGREPAGAPHYRLDPGEPLPEVLRSLPGGYATLLAPGALGGPIRRATLIARPRDGALMAYALTLTAAAAGGPVQIDADTSRVRVAGHWIATDPTFAVELPPVTPGHLPVIPASHLLAMGPMPASQTRANEPLNSSQVRAPEPLPASVAASLRDRWAVLGRVSDTLSDRVATPWGYRQGVVLQATLLAELLEGDCRYRWGPHLDLALQVLVLTLAAVLLMRKGRTALWVRASILLAAAIASELMALRFGRIWIDMPVIELAGLPLILGSRTLVKR